MGDLGSIPGLGRSPREGKGYPLQYSGLENFMDCIVHGVAKCQLQVTERLSLQGFCFFFSGFYINEFRLCWVFVVAWAFLYLAQSGATI